MSPGVALKRVQAFARKWRAENPDVSVVDELIAERREEARALDRDTARFAVGHSIDETKGKFADLPVALEHLEAMRNDLLDNVGVFIGPAQQAAAREDDGDEQEWATLGPLERYEVTLSDDGQIVVNKGRTFAWEKGEFDDPRSFIAV